MKFSHLDRAKFAKIKDLDDKLQTALLRLEYAYRLPEEAKEMYLSWMRKLASKILGRLIEKGDLPGILALEPYQLLSKSNVKKLIEQASAVKNAEIASYLLNYQEQHFAKKQ